MSPFAQRDCIARVDGVAPSRIAGSVAGLAAGLLIVLTALAAASAEPGPAPPAPRRATLQDNGEVTARLYQLDGSGSILLRSLPEPFEVAPPPLGLERITEEEIAARLHRAGAVRAAVLAGAPPDLAPARLVPEDLARRLRVLHMAVAGYTDAALVTLAARVGMIEGFSVVARLSAGSQWVEHLANVPGLALARLPGRNYLWTEDITEIGLDGTFRMTARVRDRGLLRRSLLVDRVRRFYPEVTPAQLDTIRALPAPADRAPGDLPPDVLRRFPDIVFVAQGRLERDLSQEVAAALAAARGARLREAATYLEGGNVLLGTLPGGAPYALVGRDSAAVSRALLERDQGRAVGDAEVLRAMAEDLGVDPTRLFLVEQPGVFHLDVAMTLLGPGTVVLNDALEASRLQAEWMREDHEAWRPRPEQSPSPARYLRDLDLWRDAGRRLDETIASLRAHAERFARDEARALADLEAAGLRVLRLAGRFPHPARPGNRDVMNFLNGEGGTSSSGATYFMTQGGDPRAERYVAARLLAPGTELDRLYLAPRLISRDALWEEGGIGCRVKAEGDSVDPGAWRGGRRVGPERPAPR